MQQDDARSAGADGMAVRKDDLASGQSLTMEAMQKVTRPPARRWEPQTRGRLRSPHHVLCIYALGSHLTTLGEEISRTGSFSSNSNSGPLSTPSRSSPPDTFYAFTSWSRGHIFTLISRTPGRFLTSSPAPLIFHGLFDTVQSPALVRPRRQQLP